MLHFNVNLEQYTRRTSMPVNFFERILQFKLTFAMCATRSYEDVKFLSSLKRIYLLLASRYFVTTYSHLSPV